MPYSDWPGRYDECTLPLWYRPGMTWEEQEAASRNALTDVNAQLARLDYLESESDARPSVS